MKRLNKIIILLLFVLLTIPVIVRFSYALNSDIRSDEYVIKENKIYVEPTTYNYRVEELLAKVESDKELKVYNSNNEELIKGDNVYTGCKLTVENNIYDIVVLGDITGDGKIQIGDVASLYNYYRGNKTLSDEAISSGKLTGSDNISIGDVAKLYNYYRGNKAFSYYNRDMIDVDNTVEKANNYYLTNTTSTQLGKNLATIVDDKLTNKDQVVITKEGKIELAIKKSDGCYKKSALGNYIEVADEAYCDLDITKYASNNGKLHVSGTKLMNQYNEEFRLMGASNGIAPKADNAVLKPGDVMYTIKAFSTLKSWGANGFRIFCGKSFWDYSSTSYEKSLNDLYDTIDNLIANDLYVILNWNPSSEADAPKQDSAIHFFDTLTTHYGNDSHILYEIWNEPTNSKKWSDIKAYANQVIPVIRNNAPDSIILVGTSEYDKRVDQVIGDQLEFDNVMYTHHTYSNSVNDTNLAYIDAAISAGVPVFETECAGVEGANIKDTNYINPAHGYALAKILDKYNMSFMVFCWESGYWSYNFVDINQHIWDEELPDDILSANAKWFKKILKGDYSSTSYLMAENSSDTEGLYYRSSEYKDKIVSVTFKNNKDIPTNAIVEWDLSINKDNAVIGYLTPALENDTYDLVIAANGYINLPSNSRYLFNGLTKVKTYDLTFAKTELVFNMSYTFGNNTSLETLDLSNFKTDRLTLMYATFSGDSSLKSIDFTNWTPKLNSGITSLFYNCQSLEILDLSGFDVSNVSNFSGVFYNNKSLRTLNLNNSDVGTVTNLRNTFANMKVIENLDLSGFKNFGSDCDYYNVLYGVNPNALITTGNEEFKTLMQSTYPSLNIQ